MRERLPFALESRPFDPAGPTYFSLPADGEVLRSGSFMAVRATLARPTVDVAALAALIHMRVPPNDGTPLREIRTVPPYHHASFGASGDITYEPILRPIGDELSISPEAAAEGIRARFVASVERACEGVRRVSICASGGIDSSAVVGVVADLKRRKKIEDYLVCAISFEGPGDDRPFLRDLASFHGFVPHLVHASDAAPYLRPMMVKDGYPDPWVNSPGEYLLYQRAKEWGSERMLSGLSGDQFFEGDYNAFSRALTRHPIEALADVVSLEDTYSTKARVRLWHYLAVPWLVRAVPKRLRPWRKSRPLPDWYGESLRAFHDDEELRPEPRRPLTTPMERYHDLVTFDARVGAWRQRSHYELLTGLARRDPYQDVHLAEFVSRLPPRLLFHGHRTRGLFRLAIRGLVPRSIEERLSKAYFEPFFEELFELAGGHSAFASLAEPERLAALGLVDKVRFQRAWRDSALKKGEWEGLWPVICTEMALREALS